MRSVVSIFLLALFTVPFFCGPTWLSMEKRQIQKHVRNKILPTVDEVELIKLTVLAEDTAKQFIWQHAREFEFQGKMYDIVKRKKKGNKITYLVWQDDEETHINTKIKQLANCIFDTSKDSQNSQASFQLLINTLFVEDKTDFHLRNLLLSKKKTNYYYQIEIPQGYSASIFNPPKV